MLSFCGFLVTLPRNEPCRPSRSENSIALVQVKVKHLYKKTFCGRILREIKGRKATVMPRISAPQKKITESKKASNKKWNDENMNTRYDHKHLVLPAGYNDRIKAAAEKAGESVNEYMKKAIEKRLEDEPT